MEIVRRRDGRILIEVVFALGIMGILSVSLLSYLAFFYRSQMALSAASVNHSLLAAATSFIETQAKQETFAGGTLALATESAFRILVVPTKDRKRRYIEVRYDNDGVTLVRKDGGPEKIVRPVPRDIVVSHFFVIYKDAQGHVLQPPFDLLEARTVGFEMRGHYRQDPSRKLVSAGTVPILAGGSE